MANNKELYGYVATKLIKLDDRYVPSDTEIRINASSENEATKIIMDIFPNENWDINLISLKAWDSFALSKEYFEKVKLFLKANYKADRFANEKGFHEDRENRKTIDAIRELLTNKESIITYHSSISGKQIKFDKNLNIKSE